MSTNTPNTPQSQTTCEIENTTAQTNDSEGSVPGEYLFELQTVQSSAVRILIEALKEILTDGNIEIDETGLKIMTMDPSHTVLVHLKLEHNRFEKSNK